MTVSSQPQTAVTTGRQPDPSRGKLGLQDVALEPGMLLGAGTAVMYQLAFYGVGKGVAEHSDTLQRPLDRLRTTLTYLYVLGLGTDEERRAIIKMVNKAHAHIQGDGYDAFDPELQLWVAATLAEIGKMMYDRIFGEMDPDTAERLYLESRIYGSALQVSDDMWPPTRAEFDKYWAEMESNYSSDPVIRRYAHRLLSSKEAPWFNKPLMPMISLLTRGGLSQEARDALGFTWTEREQKLYDTFWKVLPPIYRLVPRAVRQAPGRVFMWELRRRFKLGKRII